MTYPNKHKLTVPEEIKESRSSLVASGLWVRIGMVSAFGLVGALHQLFIGEMQPLSGLALAAGAGVLMVMSWWRARVVLDYVDEADEATAAVPLPAGNALGGSIA